MEGLRFKRSRMVARHLTKVGPGPNRPRRAPMRPGCPPLSSPTSSRDETSREQYVDDEAEHAVDGAE